MKRRRIQFIFITAALLAAGLYTRVLASSALGQLQAQSYPPLQIRAAAGAEITIETPAPWVSPRQPSEEYPTCKPR